VNYRHAFHAGNAVDVAKHVALVALLGALQRKPAAYAYLETHAGRGRYALDSDEALQSGEAHEGIQRLRAQRAGLEGAVARYLALVDAENPGINPTAPARRYPGSPLLAAALARAGDRMVLCESDRDEAEHLRQALRSAARAEVRCTDGWRELDALLPPIERRGLVLIDPPYEAADEFRRAADAMLAALVRWPSGVIALWHPLKATAEAAGLEHRLVAAAPTKVLRIAFRTRPDGPGLLGCGMLVANPPFALGEMLARELAVAVRIVAPGRGGVTVDWLVPERD